MSSSSKTLSILFSNWDDKLVIVKKSLLKEFSQLDYDQVQNVFVLVLASKALY